MNKFYLRKLTFFSVFPVARVSSFFINSNIAFVSIVIGNIYSIRTGYIFEEKESGRKTNPTASTRKNVGKSRNLREKIVR